MKKTVTTMLSFALALILVSSLSSGVILAKGDDDHDNRKKNKNKYETVKMHDVVILDCGFDEFETFTALVVTGLQSSTGDSFGFVLPDFNELSPTSCVEGIVAILEAGLRMVNSSGGFNPGLIGFAPGSETMFTRYTFLKTTKMRVPKQDD